MTKEEYEKALENLRILERKDNFKKWGGQVSPQINCDVVEQLIKEHFELVELLKPHGYGMLSADEFERWINFICKHNADNDMIIMFLKEQLEQIKNPQPYKFEDLKVGIWVWDDKVKWIYKIKKINSRNSIEVDNGDLTYTSLVFEEGRFFPVTKAMEYQNK